MRTVFADTYYILALWNPRDQGHAKALDFTNSYREQTLTTDWIVTELADAFARPPNRGQFLKLFRVLRQQNELTIIPSSRSLMEDGLDLYGSRLDKDWSLTDCISFIVMKNAGVGEALTGDHHFDQAGFMAVLR